MPLAKQTTTIERNRRQLLFGLGVIAFIFVLQAIVGSILDHEAEARARKLSEDSLASIEQVNRIVRDVEQERILVDDHVFEKTAASLANIEQQLANVAVDLEQAKDAYEPLVELPNEATLWQAAQTSEAGYEQGIAQVIALSRAGKDPEARELMADALRDYADLDRQLVELLGLNRSGAAEAMNRVSELERASAAEQLGIWIGGLLAAVLFGLWGTRRIARYEKQITAYARELEERNRDLDAFAGRVAHDVRGALAPFTMLPSLLRLRSTNPGRILEMADRAERSSKRATAVVDSLLAFSRASRTAGAGESAALRTVLTDIEEELAPLASELDVSIEVADIPDVELACDPGLLHVVIANLYGNAVKYTGDRDDRRVRVSAGRAESECWIAVEDTGPGIPPEAREKIFEPFFRVEGTRGPGTGIGLTTVRRILDARGGSISVEAAQSGGSRFTVRLPLAARTSTAADSSEMAAAVALRDDARRPQVARGRG
jgi:signal transduction histidine kinase